MTISTEVLTYQHQATNCKAFLAYPSQLLCPAPCVIIIHDWGGRNEFAIQKARALAELGLVGCAIDMYGNGQTSEDKSVKRALMTPFLTDRKLLQARAYAGYQAALYHPMVDKNKMAAIGYCFGGLCVLDLARIGTPLNGVASFHGMLYPPQKSIATKMTAKILILHGYDDPLCQPSELDRFAAEMKQKNGDWQLNIYGNTQHSFTNPSANDMSMGLKYDSKADQRSWQAMLRFLKCTGLRV